MCSNFGTNGLFVMLSALKCVSVCAVRHDHHIMTERGFTLYFVDFQGIGIILLFLIGAATEYFKTVKIHLKSYSDLFSLH